MGMPQEDADKLSTKTPLVTSLNALKAVNLVRRVDTLDPVGTPKKKRSLKSIIGCQAEEWGGPRSAIKS